MVFKSLQGSGEPHSSEGSSGLGFDTTVDLKSGEAKSPTVAAQISGSIAGSGRRGPNCDLSDVEKGKIEDFA